MVTCKGIYYFESYEVARKWADENDGWAGKRIREYDRGYAIQLHPSGTYAGPGVDPKTHRCYFCEAK